MSKILVFLLGFGVLGFLGYRTMYKAQVDRAEERSAPKRQLDNVRAKADEFGVKSQENMDAIEKKLEP